MDALHWAEFAAIALLTLAVLTLTYSHRQLQRRATNTESRLTTADGLLLSASEEARRAHRRLDNQERQIKALAKQLGWTDDHAYTKVLTERLPVPGGERGP